MSSLDESLGSHQHQVSALLQSANETLNLTLDSMSSERERHATTAGKTGSHDYNHSTGTTTMTGDNPGDTSHASIHKVTLPTPIQGQYTFPPDEENEELVFGRKSNLAESSRKPRESKAGARKASPPRTLNLDNTQDISILSQHRDNTVSHGNRVTFDSGLGTTEGTGETGSGRRTQYGGDIIRKTGGGVVGNENRGSSSNGGGGGGQSNADLYQASTGASGRTSPSGASSSYNKTRVSGGTSTSTRNTSSSSSSRGAGGAGGGRTVPPPPPPPATGDRSLVAHHHLVHPGSHPAVTPGRTPAQQTVVRTRNRYAREPDIRTGYGHEGKEVRVDVGKLHQRVADMRKYVKTWVRSEGRRRALAATRIAAHWRGHAVRVALAYYLPSRVAHRLRSIRHRLAWRQRGVHHPCACRPCARMGYTASQLELKSIRDRYITQSQLRALTLRPKAQVSSTFGDRKRGFTPQQRTAAERIQSVFRGWYTRRLFRVYRYQHYAASLIQAVWQGYQCRRSQDLQLRRQQLQIMQLERNLDQVHRSNVMLHRKLEQESNARAAQEDAIRFLWEQVQDLVAAQGGDVSTSSMASPAPARNNAAVGRLSLTPQRATSSSRSGATRGHGQGAGSPQVRSRAARSPSPELDEY